MHISVADTGVGISKEQQANLFFNFSQANPTIAAKYGGTGLGLSLSRNLCELMGGSITVESEPGKGSCFTIVLPADVSDLASAEPADALLQEAIADERDRKQGFSGIASPTAAPAKQQKILLVDDDVEFLELAERQLIKEGFSPISTDAPESVLQIARTVRPSAILIDILMPGLNGWDVLSTLKSDPVTAGIPVIMLTILDDRQKAMELGADGLLTKPLDATKLGPALLAARGNALQKQQLKAAG